ncbi:MAG TPA: hypothetical protein VFF87_11900 [Hyphomicrobium sp.]|nr:hypothetical protein [Hyphomicrobium sp.]
MVLAGRHSDVRDADYRKEGAAETGVSPVLQLDFDPIVGTASNGIVYRFNRIR